MRTNYINYYNNMKSVYVIAPEYNVIIYYIIPTHTIIITCSVAMHVQ